MTTRPPLSYITRQSPYMPRAVEAGVTEFVVYNHMYMPISYGRDPLDDYTALVERVTMWDVGAERQTQLRGPDALKLADRLCPRDLSGLGVGGCRFTSVCDHNGEIMADCIVLRPWEDTVWISHGDVDFELWAHGYGLAAGYDAEVTEADVPPIQLQGPLSSEVLGPLVAVDLAELPRFSCVETELAGVPVVVSATGWSREHGYEIYPLGSDRALEVWDALAESGQAHGLLVTGPNINRAVEQGILDTQYRMNSGMNPFEAGQGAMLDLDGADFVGRDALRKIRDDGPTRTTIGLVVEGEPFPMFEDFWPVTMDGRAVGHTRWAVWSYALTTNIAIALVDVDSAAAGRFDVHSPVGIRSATPHAIPFVSS